MRCGRCIAQQHDILVMPLFAEHPREVHEDSRAAQMICVGDQAMPAEIVGENLFAFSDDRFFAHPFKAEPVPCVLLTLDNHSRGVLIELVSMYPDPASLGLLKNEGERIVKFLVRAKPDKLALAHIHIRLEMLSPSRAHSRIDPVASHHKVVVVLIVLDRSDNALKA